MDSSSIDANKQRVLRHSDEIREKLKQLLAEGNTATQVGVALGMTRNAVIGLAWRMNIRFPKRKSSLKPVVPLPRANTRTRIAEITRMWRSGTSVAQIAHSLGCSRVWVYKLARRLGLAPRREARKRLQCAQPKPQHRSIPRKRVFLHAPKELPNDVFEPLAGLVPVPLTKLEDHHCRWPVTKISGYYCGANKRHDSSYCGTHQHVANWEAKPVPPAIATWREARLAYLQEHT